MRKQLLAIMLPLLIVSWMVAAETQSTSGTSTVAQAASKRAALKHVDVVRGDNEISIEITAVGDVTPKLSTLDRPNRVILDLPNTVAVTSKRQIEVDSDGVKMVRVGMNGQVPPTTRIVVDVEQAMKYDLVPDGDKLVLKLHTTEIVAKAAPAHKAAKPAAPRLVAVSQPVPAASAPKPAEEKKPASVPATSASANDFVFVEPSYQPKDNTAEAKKPVVIEPSVRAMEAAAKFGDKPAAELLPKTSAALQAQGQAANAPQAAVNMAAEQKSQLGQHNLNGPKYTGEPISVNLKDVDLKDFFRLVHEISGLNVVLDPNVKGTLTIVLDDVPWDQALDIVLKNNDLSRQLEGNVLRIATVETLKKEAESRRAQVEAEALAVEKVSVTRFLSYAHAKDVVPTVKNFLSQRGDVIADERTNALIIQDIPNVIPPIDRLLQQLDRKTQEVEIEARVVAATRSFARDIGTQLGLGWGNAATAVGGASSAGTSPVGVFGLQPNYTVVGTAAPGGSSLTQIPLFSNLPVTSPTSGFSFLNFSRKYQIDAILTMAESRGLLKILSRPRVVTQNNIQALVRQGVRVPIVTQAQLGGPPTVTYVDAFLRLTVTPQITSENTIFLNVDVENTTPDFGRTVQGNPTLITQQATTQVLVTDGGTVVIGGVIQTQNSVNVSQVPLLGNIPALGNLFKRRSVSTSNQELIFFITPRIIQT
ncbi:MAG TPA: type IV pilus secretin PilQ [Terriglobales bacterium]|nr:type IV pilus secretin PilQ [Terriglobales bacterium]